MVLTKYEKKDIRKSPKTKSIGEVYKEGNLWKFMWTKGKIRSYKTKEDAEISLEKLSGQAKNIS